MNLDRKLFVLALGVFGITTTEFGVIGILPDIAHTFNVSISRAGLLISAFAIIVAVFGPFMVMWLSSLDKKKLMVFSLLTFTIANILSTFAPSFIWLLIIRMLPAFFHPVYWSIALTAASKNVEPGKESKAIGTVFSGLTIGTVLGVPLSTFISDLTSWQFSFILSAAINFISMIGLYIFLQNFDGGYSGNQIFKKEVFKNKMLWINVVLTFFIITAMYATYGYMADFLKTVSKMNGKEISLMLLLFGFMGIGGNKLAGKYMSRFPFYTTLIFLVMLIISHLFLFWLGIFAVPVIIIVAFWGFIHSAGFLIGNMSITTSVPTSPEFINSVFTSCGNFAVTIGSLLGGIWITEFGIRQVIWSSIICLALAVLTLYISKKAV